ncbi:MAG TPA: ABC transporter substrate-binding protein [Methylomirabilota bacterium]|nr:ABC transporter substrate-binding protein [Methylomirabilota bacterium]
MAQHSVLCFALGALLFALCVPAAAQQPGKIPRIGYVSGTGSAADQGPYVEALRQGLRELGYIEGKNFLIEYRGAEGRLEPIPRIVAELVELKCDVLVLPLIGAIQAAKQATKTIPIVMITQVDPVEMGLVDSLARPGGNITGLATLQRDLSGKRLELLKEAVPKLARVGVLRAGDEQVAAIGFKEYEQAARALKIELLSLEVRGSNPDIEGAFQAGLKGRAKALVTITNNPLFRNSKRVADLATKHRLPSMYEGSGWVEVGGLMSYSANDLEVFRRAAFYVDKILKRTKPGDLPVEQPTKFEFVINLKTANHIGLNISQSVLYRADRVIK